MFLKLEDIHTIQLDHTSRCNLRCPQCARTNSQGGTNPYLPLNRDLNIENYKVILEPFRGREIKIFHCGNFGEVTASPTFLETLDFCLEYVPKARFSIVTNGSLFQPDWWANLAKKLSGNPQNRVCFSIDGLEDTHSIYRVGSNFSRLIENLHAFNAAGGISRWDYLVFEHNQHQVEIAKKLAQDIGVFEFNVKKTSRFIVSENEKYKPNLSNSKTEIRDATGNKNIDDFHQIQKKFSSFEDYAAKSPISCKYQKQGTVFIDFEMRLWPCCWLGAPIYGSPDSKQTQHLNFIFQKYGRDFNRLDLHGWDLLENDFFKRYLSESWTNDFSDADTPRLFTCGRTCGEEFEFSSGYGQNRSVKRLAHTDF